MSLKIRYVQSKSDIDREAKAVVEQVNFLPGLVLPELPEDVDMSDHAIVFLDNMNLPEGTAFGHGVEVPETLKDQLPLHAKFKKSFMFPDAFDITLKKGTQFLQGMVLPDRYKDSLPEDLKVEKGVELPVNTKLPKGCHFEYGYELKKEKEFIYAAQFKLKEEDKARFAADFKIKKADKQRLHDNFRFKPTDKQWLASDFKFDYGDRHYINQRFRSDSEFES